MFIHDVKKLADFASEISVLNELLADPKKLKALSKEVELAQGIIAKRDDILAVQSANAQAFEALAAATALAEKKTAEANDLFLKAEAAKNEAVAVKSGAEKDAKEAADRLKSAKSLEEKNETIVKKSAAKAELLEKKTTEVDAKNALLDESISRYNDAIAKLSSVKV
jgi:hypothetical protein